MLMNFSLSKFEVLMLLFGNANFLGQKNVKMHFFFQVKSSLTKFSTISLCTCERHGVPDRKNTQNVAFSGETEYLRISQKIAFSEN